MSIRKKWMLLFALIAVLSIAINSLVLSILTNRYFYTYLDQNNAKISNQLVEYARKELETKTLTNQQLCEALEAYLGDSIYQIKIYDTDGNVIAKVSDDDIQSSHLRQMGMMGNMMRGMNRGAHVVDTYKITASADKNKMIGEIHITRYSSAANSYAAHSFQSTLLRNSLFSMAIVMVLVLFLAYFLGKRTSKDLILTAKMAEQIGMGEQTKWKVSKTKEIVTIQQTLQMLENRLKLKQTIRKKSVDEMVHQTRTPLTILKMHIEGMEDGILSMEEEELHICKDQVDNLERIIANMSSYILTETNEQKLNMESFELNEFLTQIMLGMRAQFQKKGIEIALLSEEKINCTTDRYRLGQSIYNILTNAYKFTPSGGKVTISYVIEDKIISIKIKDTGCGIAQNELNQIFEPYQKGSGNESLQGDGLGLFIARENLEKMNGTIGVVSKIGEGSEFEIRI